MVDTSTSAHSSCHLSAAPGGGAADATSAEDGGNHVLTSSIAGLLGRAGLAGLLGRVENELGTKLTGRHTTGCTGTCCCLLAFALLLARFDTTTTDGLPLLGGERLWTAFGNGISEGIAIWQRCEKDLQTIHRLHNFMISPGKQKLNQLTVVGGKAPLLPIPPSTNASAADDAAATTFVVLSIA